MRHARLWTISTLATAALTLAGCATARGAGREPTASRARTAGGSTRSAAPRVGTSPLQPPAPAGPQRTLPRNGCNAALALPADFRTDASALAATPGSAATPAEALSELADGYVRLALPSAWFPVRIDAADHTLYRVNTGRPGEAFGIYLGDAPAFRNHAGDAFALALGPVAVRGTRWSENGVQRVHALALLPCATPRYVHFWMQTDAPERLASMVAVLRSLHLSETPAHSSHEVAVDATHDAGALAALTANDPLARDLAARALAGDGLRAPYPLDTVHPLADQVLLGRYNTTLGGVATQVWVQLPVRAGRAEAPGLFRALTGPALAQRMPELARAGCAAPSVVIAHDGMAVRCQGEPEVRVASEDEADATALPRALDRFLHVRATRARWRREPQRVVGGYPPALCDAGRARIAASGGALYYSNDRCVLAIDPEHPAALSAAFEGECGAIPAAPWSEPLRAVGRFDQVRGANGTYCHYTLGWNGRSGWIIAVGDEGTASGPIATGPTYAVEPRAVNTAVAFVHDLLRYATAQTSEPPVNVRPSVLAALGADHAGSAGTVELLRRFVARGGVTGPAASTVLGARATDPDHVEVTFLPCVVELVREPAGWLVAGMRATEIGATARP